MKRIDLGSLGESVNPDAPGWADLKLPPKWFGVVKVLRPNGKPTQLQAIALGTFRILESRRNLIISQLLIPLRQHRPGEEKK